MFCFFERLLIIFINNMKQKKIFENVGGNTFKLKNKAALPSHDTFITNPDTGDEILVNVKYEYTPAERGRRDKKFGVQMEPDFPASVEIHSVKDAEGKEYELSAEEHDRITDEIISDRAERFIGIDADEDGFDDRDRF
jgi:hypothetical protein